MRMKVIGERGRESMVGLCFVLVLKFCHGVLLNIGLKANITLDSCGNI